MTRILIMGLPGAGKTTLAQALERQLGGPARVDWFNADRVRAQFEDWDFSTEGRLRQAHRMNQLSQRSAKPFVICDFVAPLAQTREAFSPDLLVWVDTLKAGRFADTNALFEPPNRVDIRVTHQDAEHWATLIADALLQKELAAAL